MFGCDKNLKDSVRIERFAQKNGDIIASELDLVKISDKLGAAGIKNFISDIPGHYLCNEAYWSALKKFNNKAVFIHIPTLKNIDEKHRGHRLSEKLIDAACNLAKAQGAFGTL